MISKEEYETLRAKISGEIRLGAAFEQMEALRDRVKSREVKQNEDNL